MESFPEELTQTDYRFLSRTSQGVPDHLREVGEELDWPREITKFERELVIRRLRRALSRWVADAGGDTVGEDYIVINKEEVDGGTLTSTISIHNLAMMFSDLILNAAHITTEDFAQRSQEQAYGLKDYILKPNSFFSFLVEHPGSS